MYGMRLGTICSFPGRRLNSFFTVILERACDHLQKITRILDLWRVLLYFGYFSWSALLDFLKKNWPESINHQIFLPQNPLAEEPWCLSLSVLWINFSLNLLWLPWTLISQDSRSQVVLGLLGHQQYLAFVSQASPRSHLLKQTLLEGALWVTVSTWGSQSRFAKVRSEWVRGRWEL